MPFYFSSFVFDVMPTFALALLQGRRYFIPQFLIFMIYFLFGETVCCFFLLAISFAQGGFQLVRMFFAPCFGQEGEGWGYSFLKCGESKP